MIVPEKKEILPPLFVFFFLFIGLPLGAQELVALHPLHGPPGTAETVVVFHEQTQLVFPAIASGKYGAYPIDLSQRPPDIPPGGFPPWICPSPAITGNASHAITGEVSSDPNFHGGFRIRLYLWKMDGSRLLGSDEMAISNSRDFDNLPLFLEWIFSWIEEDSFTKPVMVYVDRESVVVQSKPDEAMWLYLGLRGGGGYSQWEYNFGEPRPVAARTITYFASANIAFQAAVQIIRFFEIQTELNLVSDFGSFKDLKTGEAAGIFTSWNLTIPILAKFVLQGERLKTGIFGGVYLYLPITQTGSTTAQNYLDYTAGFPGFLFGVSIGWTLGPGRLFMDSRFEHDRRWQHKSSMEEVFYRNSFKLNIGYEMGFFSKRSRSSQRN